MFLIAVFGFLTILFFESLMLFGLGVVCFGLDGFEVLHFYELERG